MEFVFVSAIKADDDLVEERHLGELIDDMVQRRAAKFAEQRRDDERHRPLFAPSNQIFV